MPRTGERGGPRTRARILEAANRLFLQRGYEAVTVAEVAREAGVSSVTVFKHFTRKEDLFMDRAADAAELLRAAVRDRGQDLDVVSSLHRACVELRESRHPLSGLAENSVPFFRTIADSVALTSRARGIAAELQAVLTDELDRDASFEGDPDLLAAFFVAGYSTILVRTASAVLAGEPHAAAAADQQARIDVLFAGLRRGVEATRPPAGDEPGTPSE